MTATVDPSAIRACPFCGETPVQREAGLNFQHPDNDCFYGQSCIPLTSLEAWNTRTPRPVDQSAVEAVAKSVHEELSRIDVLGYLDLPDDTADRIARAAIAAMPTDPLVGEMATLERWLLSIAKIDLTEIVADGGITAGMVVQQEARTMAGRITRARKSGGEAS